MKTLGSGRNPRRLGLFVARDRLRCPSTRPIAPRSGQGSDEIVDEDADLGWDETPGRPQGPEGEGGGLVTGQYRLEPTRCQILGGDELRQGADAHARHRDLAKQIPIVRTEGALHLDGLDAPLPSSKGPLVPERDVAVMETVMPHQLSGRRAR